MPTSLQRRLSVSLSVVIVLAGIVAAGVSFVIAFRDATAAQDLQLQQVAAALSAHALDPVPSNFLAHDDEDAESHLVVKPLGHAQGPIDPDLDVELPPTLRPGLQTIRQGAERWRAMISGDGEATRFGVAQRVTIRNDAALRSALVTVVPLVLLIPVLLISVAVVLRRAFAPLAALSAAVDAVDGSSLAELPVDAVPTEARSFVLAVNRLLKRLGLALDQQRRLVSHAAHELRSPMAALTLQAANVEAVELSADAKLRVATLRAGMQRMSALLEQLLSFARIQGTTVTRPRSIAFDALVRDAIEDALPLAQAKAIDLGCVQMQDVAVNGDLLHLQALVRNAIDNAVRYTPSGGTVDVTIARDGPDAVFSSVEDTGPGIAEADRERVFEPFVRVLGSHESGSGLGLAIARTAAQELGGSIALARRSDGRSACASSIVRPRRDGTGHSHLKKDSGNRQVHVSLRPYSAATLPDAHLAHRSTADHDSNGRRRRAVAERDHEIERNAMKRIRTLSAIATAVGCIAAMPAANAQAASGPSTPMYEIVQPVMTPNPPQTPEQAESGRQRGRDLPPPRCCSRRSTGGCRRTHRARTSSCRDR